MGDKVTNARTDKNASTSKPIEIFYSYAREDQSFLLDLQKHLKPLKREGLITEFYDGEIHAGLEADQEIKEHLDSADIILLLLSPDFLHSDYIWNIELEQALKRHQQGTARVIPIYVRECDWRNSKFSHLQGLPHRAKPIGRSRSTQDKRYLEVVTGLRKVIEELRPRP